MPFSLSRPLAIFCASLLFLLFFAIVMNALSEDSFWMDEGFSAWVVRDTEPMPDSPREILRYLRDDYSTSFERLRLDVHPPLYYLLLNTWTHLVGQSEVALRLPSALMSIVALAATYAMGATAFNRRTGLMAVCLLATSGFFLYYSREARSYGLYLALASLSTWAAWRFWKRPQFWRGIVYSLFASALIMTHYTALPFVAAQGIYVLLGSIFQRHNFVKLWVFLPIGMIFALWWVIFGQAQFTMNTSIEAAGALPSDLSTLAAFWLLLTSGMGGLFILILLLSRVNPLIARFVQGDSIKTSAILYLLLLGIVPLIVLFSANANGLTILQMRYFIAILPLWAIFVGYALSEMRLPAGWHQSGIPRYAPVILSIFVLLWIAYSQVSSFREFWAHKSDWRGTVALASTERQPLEPALVYLDEKSPFAYYAYQDGLLNGISINIAWREFSPQEISEIADSLRTQETVWAFVAMQAPESWDAIANLSQNRGVSYRDEVQWTIFYRFEESSSETLTFNFDGRLAYQNPFYRQFSVTAGEEFCAPVSLEAVADIPENYSIGLHLTRGYNEVVNQVDEGLGALAAGEIFQHEFCMQSPEAGDFHVRLVIYDWRNPLERLPVFERDLLWSDYLMLGIVHSE